MNREARDARRLRRAFAKPEPQTREAFLLHRVEGLSYREIAARLGITAEAVERHVADALYELARRIDRPWWKFW
jgi:RNA polymerase sigma-70 factor (ECF subfamily)